MRIRRRRFLSIVAVSAAAPASALAVGDRSESIGTPTSVWMGETLGGVASIRLVGEDRARSQTALQGCVAEMQRLESIFSLYRADSALSKLNASGELISPPMEFVELLSFATSLAMRSDGAFDPTVQPLYALYAKHFATPGAAAQGPSRAAVDTVLQRVGYDGIELTSDRIRLRRSGMAITLNGVAQGYITDRIADRLRRAGFTDVLVDLGEARALGRRGDGEPWRAAIADPSNRSRSLFELELGESGSRLPALATSSGAGTRFAADSALHHLLDPRTGTSADRHASVSVAAERATVADGLSTALSIIAPERAGALLAAWPSARAWFVDDQGRVTGSTA